MTQELPYLNENDGLEVDQMQHQFMLKHSYCHKKYHKNDEIVMDYDLSTIIYVAKGQLKVFIANKQGVEKLLYYVEENNTFLGNYGAKKDVFLRLVAANACEVYFLNAKTMIADVVFKENGLDALLESMENRICAMADNLLDLANCSNRGKICKFIQSLALNSTLMVAGYVFIKILPTREDIALFVGTHKVNVIKCLSQLEKDHIIKKHGKGLIVYDMAALEQIIAEEYRA